MELTRIGDDGLKIELSAEDMLLYNIAGGCIDCAPERAPHVIREILREARRKTGFDDSGGRIMASEPVVSVICSCCFGSAVRLHYARERRTEEHTEPTTAAICS